MIRVNGASRGTETNYTVNEGNHVQVILTIDSNPDVTSIFLLFGAKQSQLSFNHSGNDYTCQLPKLMCENSGTFSIIASNGVEENASRSLFLNIQCRCQWFHYEDCFSLCAFNILFFHNMFLTGFENKQRNRCCRGHFDQNH